MTQERFKLPPFVAVMLQKENKVVLTKRLKEGWGCGEYALPGGGVDGDETIRQAAAREVREELNVIVKPDDLEVLHVMHLAEFHPYECIVFFLKAEKWQGAIQNAEPHKHESVEWFALSNMPDNMPNNLKQFLEKKSENEIYSEFGWDK